MNNNLENYLSKLIVGHRNNIVKNCKSNKFFDKFISCCMKLNIYIFNDDNSGKSHSYILKKINEYKELIVKSYGMKIIKEYKENINKIDEFMKINYKKLKVKLNYIELIIDILNNFLDENNLYTLLNYNNITNKKINYTNNFLDHKYTKNSKIEYVEFSQDLFVTSEELSSDEDSQKIESINLVYSINTPYIAEYSN